MPLQPGWAKGRPNTFGRIDQNFNGLSCNKCYTGFHGTSTSLGCNAGYRLPRLLPRPWAAAAPEPSGRPRLLPGCPPLLPGRPPLLPPDRHQALLQLLLCCPALLLPGRTAQVLLPGALPGCSCWRCCLPRWPCLPCRPASGPCAVLLRGPSCLMASPRFLLCWPVPLFMGWGGPEWPVGCALLRWPIEGWILGGGRMAFTAETIVAGGPVS